MPTNKMRGTNAKENMIEEISKVLEMFKDQETFGMDDIRDVLRVPVDKCKTRIQYMVAHDLIEKLPEVWEDVQKLHRFSYSKKRIHRYKVVSTDVSKL